MEKSPGNVCSKTRRYACSLNIFLGRTKQYGSYVIIFRIEYGTRYSKLVCYRTNLCVAEVTKTIKNQGASAATCYSFLSLFWHDLSYNRCRCTCTSIWVCGSCGIW